MTERRKGKKIDDDLDLKRKKAEKDHVRGERFKDVINWIAIGAICLLVLIFLTALIALGYHYINIRDWDAICNFVKMAGTGALGYLIAYLKKNNITSE